MSKLKDPDEGFVLQPDDLTPDEYDDELNDETFGDPVMDDWETAQDLYNDKMESCLNQLQKVLGDRMPEIDLKIAASKYNYNYELTLNSLLSNEQLINNQESKQRTDNELSSKLTDNTANGYINHSKHNLHQIEQNLLSNNETDRDDDLIKNTLDRVANHQIQYHQLMQQMHQQQAFRNQQIVQNLPLLLNQQQQFTPDLHSPHFLQRFNSPQPQFLSPHFQQFVPQNNNNNSNNLANSSALSDSFASMNLSSNLEQHQNGFDLNSLNQLTNNIRANNNFLINQENLNQTNNNFVNGNAESAPAKRAVTLEEIENGLLEESKIMGLENLENTLLSDNIKDHHQSNKFGFNIDNLNEFPKLDNEYHTVKKTIHEEKPAQSTHFNFNQHNNGPRSNNYRNYNNQQNNVNRNQNNNINFRNYHPSLIPNPLNPLEMISNTMVNKNSGYKQYQKYHNNQRNYMKNNNFQINKSDEYAGLMTPKDINWLRRIQQMQLEFDDPYVQDYYYVNYQTRKIAAELKKRDKINGEMHSAPQLVIPERGNKVSSNESTTENSRYVPPDFSGSLGKIRVANVNYPRKLLDFNNKPEKLTSKNDSVNIEPHGRTELNKFRKLLLDIERNLTNVLKIDHEDKKIAALPYDAQISHLEERKRLCDELFNGILTTEDKKNINFNVAKIRKGCMLIFKVLLVLDDPEKKTVIISDLLKVDNFHYVVMQKDKTLYCLDYGQVLIDSIKTIKDCDFSLLLKIADGLDDASVVAKFQCGQEIIEVLLNQYNCFNVQDKNQKLSWLKFLERVLEDVDDIPHLRKICNDHIVALTE